MYLKCCHGNCYCHIPSRSESVLDPLGVNISRKVYSNTYEYEYEYKYPSPSG